MRKQLLWLLLFVVTIASVVVGWNWHSLKPTISSLLEQESSAQSLPPSDLAFPIVDADRLWGDLEALSSARYSDRDRRQTLDYLSESLQEMGWSPQTQAFDGGINLHAERSGTDPDAGKILVAAHYDTVAQSPGADDNASGVAAVLEVARLLTEPTPRSLQIAFFDLEEVGLLGSTAFVDEIAQPERLAGALILDMVGYACDVPGCQSYPPLPIEPPTDRGNFLAVIGDRGHPDLIDSFDQASRDDLPPVLSLSIPVIAGIAPDLIRSDHAPFWDRGIGAVLLTDTANFRSPHYHQPTDTLETIDRSFFSGAAQLVVNATTVLLNAVD